MKKKLKVILLTIAITFVLALLAIFLIFGARIFEKPYVNYKKAAEEYNEYIREMHLPSYYMSGYKSIGDFLRYHITGDGRDDLIQLLYYGSGMPRVSFSMYDPVNHKGYILDSYNYSYKIESCDKKKKELVVIKYDAATGDEHTGTIVLEDDKLVFVEE